MRLPLITLLLLAPLLTLAQSGTITGKVTNAETQASLAKATVFLTGTTYITAANDDGTFELKDLKHGKYLLIVTMVGFEQFSQSVSVGTEAVQVNISLKPKATSLREVSIKLPEDWERNYRMFVKRFIGTSANARKCKILNSEVLNFNYDKATKTLSAWSDDPMIIENRALGYMIKVLLVESSFSDHVISWYMYPYYEELQGTQDEFKKWETARKEAFKKNHPHSGIAEDLPNNFIPTMLN